MPTNNSWDSENPAQVERGGTGRDTLADHGLLVGSGVNPVNTIVYAGAANGIPLVSVAGADPNFGVATVPGGGTGNTTISAFCPVTGGGTNQAPLQTVSPAAAQPGYVLTYTGTPGNPTMPVWAAQTSSGGNISCGFQVVSGTFGSSTPTGDGANIHIPFTYISYDSHGGFTLPYSYTFPYTGLYSLNLDFYIGTTTSHVSLRVWSALKGDLLYCNSEIFSTYDPGHQLIFPISWLQFYTAGQVESLYYMVSGGAKNVTLGSNMYFTGYLAMQIP
jgi:hypothetical protein